MEVVNVLKDIDDKKAPGCDGFNTFFFKKAWSIIGDEVTYVVLHFFHIKNLYLYINCTTVTFIPKVKPPYTIKQFRPISCCTILYKLISKILTTSLQGVMDNIIDQSQSIFFGRIISDYIIISHELVKGYGRKGVSPRCMIKVDMQKAYDSLEWPYLEQILYVANFSYLFIEWIMTCVRSVSYSIIINGQPSTPFQAKKGLRQGIHCRHSFLLLP